jgi:cytoskeletal protein CcmA (bactofilin family)
MPVTVNAVSDDTNVINRHGIGTYIGTYEAWADHTWRSEEFTEVTGEDVECSEDLIIKGGKVGNVTVDGDSSLTIYDGTVSNVECSGDVTMSGGAVYSIHSSDDISINGGTVKGDVEAEGDVTLSGKLTVGNNVSGENITVYANSGDATSVNGTVSFGGTMEMQGTNYKISSIDGQSSGTLRFKNYNGTLPNITNVDTVSLGTNSIVTTAQSMQVEKLTVDENAEFATTSTLLVGTLTGPGTVAANAGSLTIEASVSDFPVLDFNGTAKDGTYVFQAKTGAVSPSGVIVYGYGLTKKETSDYDSFTLSALTGNGVALNASAVPITSGGYATVTATVTPNLSSFDKGTKLMWKLIDATGKFSISSNSDDNTCKIYLSSSAGGTACSARLAVCLVDYSGSILADYKSASCLITSSAGAAQSSGSAIKLDTSYVTIPVRRTYSVLAITNSSKPPVQTSYNSAVATVGKAKAYSYNGKVGWLYPITAVSKGGVTINIGGEKVIVTVS